MTASPCRHHAVDTTRPQGKKATQEHLEKDLEKDVESGLQVQLKEGGVSNKRQELDEDKWSVVYALHLELQLVKSSE